MKKFLIHLWITGDYGDIFEQREYTFLHNSIVRASSKKKAAHEVQNVWSLRGCTVAKIESIEACNV